ncbi:MAG: trehalose-phosphatase [Omnitrophica bacterium]|nr:trehalose-phosphatase [Candidatus Omnitrophota bacterium]
MQYLFSSRRVLEKRMQAKKHILLCLDFDGTLVPIYPRPQDALLEENVRSGLVKLSSCKFFSIGIISGRALKDIKEKVKIKHLIYAGNHGLEIAYRGKIFIYPPAKKYIPLIIEIGKKLTRALRAFPQAVLERKGLSLSLHYRLVKLEKLSKLRKIFFKLLKPYLAVGKVKLTHGKKVWEVRPSIKWDKGKAFLWLKDKLKSRDLFSIYIGDDLTDEDAFRAVNKIGGLSILVGRRKSSQAKYYLKNIQDTQKLLRVLLERCAR